MTTKISQSLMPTMLSTYGNIIFKSAIDCQSVTLHVKVMFYNVHTVVNKTYMIVRESYKGICSTVQIIISEPVLESGLLKS